MKYINDFNMKIAKINLNRKEWNYLDINNSLIKKYIGGSGLGTRLLIDEEIVNPLESANPLIFLNGPFANTVIPTSGRHQIISRSPLTGIFGEADVGGSWGNALKKTGFDGLMIIGKSESPCFISVRENEIDLKDAFDLWGLDTYETSKKIYSELEDVSAIACIGPAGEKGCLLSGIFFDGNQARAAARCGLGTVMGSKKLKAVVVMKGSSECSLRDPDYIKEQSKRLRKIMAADGAG